MKKCKKKTPKDFVLKKREQRSKWLEKGFKFLVWKAIFHPQNQLILQVFVCVTQDMTVLKEEIGYINIKKCPLVPFKRISVYPCKCPRT